MRSRSPSRRSTPPPPRISRRSPGGFRTRGKSPDRRRRMPPPGMPKYVPGGRGGSPTRGRDRREFRHSPRRRSRSPLHPQREPKARSFSPGKRKLSPKRERERERERPREQERERGSRPNIPPPRKRTRSKSPETSVVASAREGGHLGSYVGNVGGPSEVSPPGRNYQGPAGAYPQGGPGSDGDHTNRNMVSLSERFHGASGPGSYKKEQSDLPVFRGPEGTGFDVNELKKITVDIRRNLPVDTVPIERSIMNPEDVVLVRRPEMTADERDYTLMLRDAHASRGRYESDGTHSPSSGRKTTWDRESNHYIHIVNKREGSHPIFARDEIIQAARPSSGPVEEHRRVVAILGETPPLQSQGSSRFESPGRYTDAPPRSRDGYYPSGEREPPREYPRSSRDYDRGHGPPPSFEQRERSREDRFDRRSEDLRHELEQRRRDDNRYSSQGDGRRYDRNMDYRGDSERGGSSDLRMRINEKRTDRHDDRDSGHHRMMDHRSEPMERDRERDRPHRGMMQPSPPGSERRRGPGEGFGRSMGEGKMRGDGGGGRMVHHGGPTNRRDDMPDRFHQEPPEFSNQRSDRFHYKSWDSNPEHVPKGRAYFEHDNRDDEFMRGRGRGMMGQRGSGMRGRGTMRGRPFRGGAPTRMFMGRSGGRRGGYPPRKSSPDLDLDHGSRERHYLERDDFELLDGRHHLHRR